MIDTLPIDDCILVPKPAHVAKAAPRRPVGVPVKRKVKKPIYKADVPAEWELNCDEGIARLPGLPGVEPEVAAEFTPVPWAMLDVPADAPSHVPAVADQPESFETASGGPYLPPLSPPVWVPPIAITAPVPEPSTWALLLIAAGLFLRTRLKGRP